jgi:DNA-directed RNA polymerase subunit RPC12/RpoP
MKRIARKRFDAYAEPHVLERGTLGGLLEYWADKSIAVRRWQLGPCRRCNQKYFVERLDIQESIVCSNCGNRIALPERVRVGYSLDRPVEHALKEGIMPIVLAGRFLRNMTSRGFFWIPGVKYSKGGADGDIDFLACCDGLLVFGEAKTAPRKPDVWREATDQFFRLASVARECNAALVVFAAQVSEFPDDVASRIETELSGKIPFLLLKNQDLEIGYRKTQNGGPMDRLTFGDLIADEFPEKAIQRTSGPRQIGLGWGLYTAQQ